MLGVWRLSRTPRVNGVSYEMPLYRGAPPSSTDGGPSTGSSSSGRRRSSEHQQGLAYRTLRRIKRFLKATYGILLTCLSATGDALDTALEHLGILMVELVKAIAWPFKWIFPTPEILNTFKGRPLAMVLPLMFVCNIIMLLYIVYVFCVMPLLGISLSSFSSITFHLCSLLAMVSYYKAVVTDPGKIPDTGGLWSSPSPQGPPPPHLYERKGKDGSIRYCNKEHKFKPDRAHFCSPMGRNVLRMDHYCPWLANSVGFYNHKYFFLFLLYVVIACNTVTCQILHALAHVAGGFAANPGQLLFLLEGFSISGLLSVIVTPFFAFHAWLISTNVTTVEYCEKRRDGGGGEAGELSKNIVARMPQRSPYDVGLIRNWQAVMGHNMITWLLPTRPRGIGQGLAFEVNKEAKEVLRGELGILHDGDLETGRRRSSGGRTRQPIDMSSDEEEDNTHVKIREALMERQRELEVEEEEPEAPPSPEGSTTTPSSPGHTTQNSSSCCGVGGGRGGRGSLLEYGLEQSNHFADFITDLYMNAWKILNGPRGEGKRRRRTPRSRQSTPTIIYSENSPDMVEVGSPIEQPKAAA